VGSDATPLPFKLLICFLILLGVEGLFGLGSWLLSNNETAFTTTNPYRPNLVNQLIWIVVYPLLAILLYMRGAWGRILTQIIFALHFVYLGRELAISNPELWVYLSDVGRLRMLATFVVDMTIVAYLFSPQARSHLNQ
jgi:hypothetical protein